MAGRRPSKELELEPDVSFVIAAFNADLTIDRAVRSALAQEGVSVEVLVVDDCSTDFTADVVKGIGDKRVRLLPLVQNRGPGGARNAGLEAAKGRWVAVLDADDAVQPDRMTRMIGRAEKASAPIAIDNLEIARLGDRRRTMFAPAALSRTPELSLAAFIEGNMLFKSTFNYGYVKPAFERRFLEKNGLRYDEVLRIGEDYLLLAAALANGRCVIEPKPGYIYHVMAGSISRVLELHHVEAMIAADATFASAHRLEGAGLAAFRRRERNLRDAAAFLSLVRHIKEGSPFKALSAAFRNPVAVGHLRMPIAKRLGLDRLAERAS